MSTLGPEIGALIRVRTGNGSDGPDGSRRLAVPAHLGPHPGLAVTTLPGGRIWRLTHLASGHRVAHRDWGTPQEAHAAGVACCAGVDWTQGAEALCADPGAQRAAARLLQWRAGLDGGEG